MNMAAATSERLASELQAVREGRDAVAFLLTFLEQSPRLLFAMENPFLSDLWNLPEVKEALQRNKDWKLTRVDQCAYGRRSQKATRILHNTLWVPEGVTGNGRCCIGTCAGTAGNKPGDNRHTEQTIAKTKDRRPSQGEKHAGGRRDYTMKAVVNSVAAQLTREIYRAARNCLPAI
jgi:hypothetical protein